MRRALLACALLAGCGGTKRDAAVDVNNQVQKSWWQWHADKQSVDLAVAEAIDEPDGGDYAKAIAITRASDRPQAIKEFDIGLLIIGGFDQKGSRRSTETLQQGLELLENTATQPGETSEVAPQQLGLLFERGAGIAPDNIPIDPVVANCWHKLENGQAGDPTRCIALRRQRLAHVGR